MGDKTVGDVTYQRTRAPEPFSGFFAGDSPLSQVLGSKYKPWGGEKLFGPMPTVVKVTVEYDNGMEEVWSLSTVQTMDH